MKKENKGITLIALVITIIVLLILAGVTITTLTGENGLITKASDTQKETLKAEGKERIQVEVLGSYNKNGDIEVEQLNKNLKNITGLKVLTETEKIEELPVKVKLNEYQYLIKSDGTVIVGLDAEYIKNNANNFYGSYVTNYNSKYDVGIKEVRSDLGKWQIFLADDDNIYLIASRNISREYTESKNGKGFNYDENLQKTAAYTMCFTDIKDEYFDTEEERIIPQILSKFDENTRNKYHKWLNKEENQEKSFDCIKGVLSMLDTTIWNKYNNEKYAKYVIGGPTLEMFCDSYNATHSNDKVYYNEEYSNGYQIQRNEEESTGSRLLGFKISETMYFQGNDNYWLASHSNSKGILAVGAGGWPSGGIVGYNYYNKNRFRPIVCLKSNTHIIENVQGNNNITYELELD